MSAATSNGKFPSTVREAALWYSRHGFLPIPAGFRTKHPVDPETGQAMEDWTNYNPGAGDLGRYFPKGRQLNIAVLNGAPSDNHVDVDLDSPEARKAAELLLPFTGMIFGRASSPRSHWMYKVDRDFPKAHEKFLDLNKDVLLELRGSGGITIVPPSCHKESGEAITWDKCDEPGQVRLADLQRAVAELAACALLAQHWPAGSRHDGRLALAGGLLRAGWAEDRTIRFLEAVAAAADNSPRGDCRGVVTSTAKRLANGENMKGWPSLEPLLGERGKEVVRLACQYLGLGSVSQPEQWQPPVPLRCLPAVPPFPTHLLPDWLRSWACALAESIQVPVDLPAVLALTVASAGVSRKFRVHVRADWYEHAQQLSGFCQTGGPG